MEAPDGSLAAYADVTHVDDPAYVTSWAPVHPAHRGLGVGTALLDWIEGRAATLPSRALHQHVEGGDAAGRGLLERAGFRAVRTRLHMVRDLDEGAAPTPAVHAPVTIRPMHDGDERAVHHVMQVAFAQHFALTVEPFDVWWEEWSADPLFDRDLFLLAEDAAAGIVGVACDFEDAGVGWVGDLGVLPAWRGRGSGPPCSRRRSRRSAAVNWRRRGSTSTRRTRRAPPPCTARSACASIGGSSYSRRRSGPRGRLRPP